MDNKNIIKNLEDAEIIVGPASYKRLGSIDKNLVNDLISLNDNDNISKAKIIIKLFYEFIMDDNQPSRIIYLIYNSFIHNNKRITRDEILECITNFVTSSYSAVNDAFKQTICQNPVINPVPINQQNETIEAPAANMNLGFDVTRFMNRTPQQNMNVYNSSVPNTGYVHQNAAQQQQQYMNEAMNNMIADIREKIDFSNNHITFTNNPDEYKEDIIALSWLCNNENIRFQLINMGVAPGAKFICVENDNPAYKYKFTIGGKTVYLSLKNTTGVDGKVYFAYNIC